MQHKGTVTIETENLVLRPFDESDIEPSFNNWTSDSEMTQYLTWEPHPDADWTRNVITNMWMPDYQKPDFYQWAIIPKDVGECVGTISTVDADESVEMVEIGYCIGSKYWGRGIMSEALAALIKFFICEVGVNRVQAKHDPKNPASGRVMQKCGMVYEGTTRQSDRNNQGIVDASIYSVLASEYKK